MKIAVDTDVLVNAHVPGMERHDQAREGLSRCLEAKDVTLVLTPLALHEFVHIVTDARRFDPPVTMSEAIAVARDYLGRSNVECLAVNEAAVLAALDLLDHHRLGRKRIADTLIAATLLQHGVHRLFTFNRSDFTLFEGLHVLGSVESGAWPG
jgi:predicted nucleic acid-binding protein